MSPCDWSSQSSNTGFTWIMKGPMPSKSSWQCVHLSFSCTACGAFTVSARLSCWARKWLNNELLPLNVSRHEGLGHLTRTFLPNPCRSWLCWKYCRTLGITIGQWAHLKPIFRFRLSAKIWNAHYSTSLCRLYFFLLLVWDICDIYIFTYDCSSFLGCASLSWLL